MIRNSACRATMFLLLAGVVSYGALAQAQQPQPQNITAENIAEGVILVYGNGNGRAVLNQIRRNGIERGKTSRVQTDGRVEEDKYEMRFVRGDSAAKDKVRVDRKTPQAEYSLVYGEGKVFGIINGSEFTPRADAIAELQADHYHGIDALLRYKENGSKVSLVRRDKSQGLEVYVVDLTDKEEHATRYYVSVRSLRVLWLEYEEAAPGSTTTKKYQRRFHDYRVAQGTLVPYRVTVLEDGKQTLENRVLTVTYGAKMDDSLFLHPDQAAAANP